MRFSLHLLFCFTLFASVDSYAEIVTDGSVGAVKNLSGQMNIPQSLGETMGNNLFHSFKTFNINTGESATFTGANTIKNVISRVTGTEISTINGLLKSEVGNANFYFINPNGVTFGAKAEVNVPADFHVSTADNLRFADGKVFSATHPSASSLTIAEPASFGFLGNSSTNIGKISIDGSQLEFKKGNTLDVVAKNIIVTNDAILSVPEGEIRFIAIQGKGDIDLQKIKDYLSLPSYPPSFINAGNITFDSSDISTESDKGGLIEIWGNNVFLKNSSQLSSNSYGQGNAGIINIISDNIDIYESTISSKADKNIFSFFLHQKSKSGVINFQSNKLNIRNGYVSTDTWTQGSAGVIKINTGILNIFDDAVISSDSRWISGDAGTIKIKGDTINIFSGIISARGLVSNGKNGSIKINANKLDIFDNGKISAGGSFSNGNTGSIKLNINKLNVFKGAEISVEGLPSLYLDVGSIKIKGGNINIFGGSILAGQFFSTGNTGIITINANKLNIRNGGKVSVEGYFLFSGDVGSINIDVNELKIDGNENSLTDTGILADITFGSGKGGNITVNAQKIDINNGKITTTSHSAGNAGNITVETQKLNLIHDGSITSETTGSGNAGSISVTGSEINLDNAAIKTTANTDSKGKAGSVTLNATRSLIAINSASINSSTSGGGQAGNVTINTPYLLLDKNAEISALAAVGSSGEIGKIELQNANTVTLNKGGEISLQNDGVASDPTLIIPNDLNLSIPNLFMNGGVITAATSGNVNAGNVFVKTQNSLEMSNGALINTTTSGVGNAGNVTVKTPTLTIDNATITAKTSSLGNAGSVIVSVDDKLTATNNASINSSTSGDGSAGSATVAASMIKIDNSNVSAEALKNSNGQTGNVTVTASKAININNQGKISIQNDARVANHSEIKGGKITVSAPDIDLKDSSITAASTGNVDAGNITVNFSHWLTMDPSFISTSAIDGNGGDITINGGELINLQNSGFLTSVTGANGNGGNINVAANTLIMNTAAIQANAQAGTGGDIGMNINTLIPSQESLIKGGVPVFWKPNAGFNVIQAASAIGVSGNINLTSPQFSISGTIKLFDEPPKRPNLNQSFCQEAASESSFVSLGKGGKLMTDAKQVFIAPIKLPKSSANFESLQNEEANAFFDAALQLNNQPCTAK